MPFSWKKKSRCNRFHQLVADHLQSPKHGGSLVVETGFPTSLIDLYVRNRSRFRKSATNKQTEFDSPSPLSPSSGVFVDLNNLSSSVTDYRESDEIIEEDVIVAANDGEIDPEIDNSTENEVKKSVVEIDNSSENYVKKSGVMLMLNHILVVLFILVLALGTKRFTVGITVSAFVLLFIELVGEPMLLRRLCSIRPSESSDHETENVNSSKKNASVVCREVMEIEEVEAKQEVRSENGVDEARSEVLMEVMPKSSRRAIMKSKMKKLVPKKLRKSSMGSKDDISCEFKEEKVMKHVQDVKPLVISSECSDIKGETFCILKQENDKIDCSNKEKVRESQQNSGYLVLCLIVLVGLIGGRVLALVLSLSWCLILKRLQWRNVKFPIL